MKRILIIFLASFILNALWENLHVFLYAGYKGGEITEFILLRAALWDAVMISAILLPFLYVRFLHDRPWIIIIIGLAVATVIEWWALGTGRWAYNEYMPIVPVLSVGLTPLVQLGLLGYVSFYVEEYVISRSHSLRTPRG